jgi:hypothetical protein
MCRVIRKSRKSSNVPNKNPINNKRVKRRLTTNRKHTARMLESLHENSVDLIDVGEPLEENIAVGHLADDAGGAPDVHALVVVLVAQQHLRRAVVARDHLHSQRAHDRRDGAGQAEISDF